MERKLGRRAAIAQLAGGVAGAAGLVTLGVHQLGAAQAVAAPEEVVFAQWHRGRWIAGGGPRALAELERQERGVLGHDSFPVITMDGVSLHVVRNAGGGYSTTMNHYESFPTLLAAARAAAESLQGARLEEMA